MKERNYEKFRILNTIWTGEVEREMREKGGMEDTLRQSHGESCDKAEAESAKDLMNQVLDIT